MSGVRTITVEAGDAGLRLDRWFKAHYPSLGHGALEKLLRKGLIRVDGGRVKANRRLEAGEAVRVPPEVTAEEGPRHAPQGERDDRFVRSLVIHEDEALIVLNKPSGLAVQGGAGTTRHVDGMLAAFENNGERPRLVHRLDRDTSGVLVLARTRAVAARLGFALQQHEVEKEYWALVAGAPSPREGTIDFAIAKRMVRVGDGEQERVTPAEGEDAKRAITDFLTVDDAAGAAAFTALRPHTGRTHQLRVHMAAIGAPIVGDRKYGGRASVIDGVDDKLHLHCRAMRFKHPLSGAPFEITAKLSGHMEKTWRFFGFSTDATIDWPESAA